MGAKDGILQIKSQICIISLLSIATLPSHKASELRYVHLWGRRLAPDCPNQWLLSFVQHPQTVICIPVTEFYSGPIVIAITMLFHK